MKKNKSEFDLIIIDIFIDILVPESFLNSSFWNDIIRSISEKGTILFSAS